ncbi:MAG: sugar diacid recognition domain-containing protein [Roseiflexaceae bacterium]
MIALTRQTALVLPLRQRAWGEQTPGGDYRQFVRVSQMIVRQAADLLCAPALVIDARERVVAESGPHCGEMLLEAPGALQAHLRLPFHAYGEIGTVIVGEPGNGEVVSPRLAQALIELVINQAAAVERQPNQHEQKNRLIHDLLHGVIDDELAIQREARNLGLDLNPPRAVILIDASDYILADDGTGATLSARVQRRVQLLIGSVVSFFRLPNDTICAYIGDGIVAVLKASNTKNLVAWAMGAQAHDNNNPSWANLSALVRAGESLLTHLRADTGAAISIGIGRHHPGLSGLARSFQDACAALSLGRRFQGQNHVHCLDRLGIAAFVGVADERTKVELATYLLSPLDQDAELLTTLDIFFQENCSPSATAQRLSIHRNTLSYRLDKITSLIGLDPRHFDDAVQIRLALVLRSLS